MFDKVKCEVHDITRYVLPGDSECPLCEHENMKKRKRLEERSSPTLWDWILNHFRG